MDFQELSLPGLILITPKVFEDERGFFLERYNQRVFRELGGIEIDFIQDNHSRSTQHVLRGLHFQVPPFAQDKLVWVVQGEVYDVALDLRRDSPTFGRWQGVTLSAANRQMLLVPKGFAHAFLVLSETVDFLYKASQYYSHEYDRGILWNDPTVGVTWPVDHPILSAKDQRQPTWEAFVAAGSPF